MPTSAALNSVRRDLRKVARPERAKSNAWFFKTNPGDYGEGDRVLGVAVPQLRADKPARQAIWNRATAACCGDWRDRRRYGSGASR